MSSSHSRTDYDKQWCSIEDQLALLAQRGLVIDHKEHAKQFLSHIGYYRFSGYCLAFEDGRHAFIAGTTFKAIKDSYLFDVKIRDAITDENFNETYIRLDSIGYPRGKKTPEAKATIHKDTVNGPKAKSITLKQGTVVADQTNRDGYDGYIVESINAEEGLEHVRFSNGVVLEINTEQGGMAEEYLKAQIEQTVEEHFKKVKKFKKQEKTSRC